MPKPRMAFKRRYNGTIQSSSQNSEITKFIIMGVAGSGKLPVVRLLSNKIGVIFIDGDDTFLVAKHKQGVKR